MPEKVRHQQSPPLGLLPPLGTYDVIKLTSEEAESLAVIVNGMTAGQSGNLLDNPALPHFTLVAGPQRIDFLPHDTPYLPVEKYARTPNLLVRWAHGTRKAEAMFFAELGQIKSEYSREPHHICVIHEDYDFTEQEMHEFIEVSYRLYLGVQKTLYNRPTVFKENTGYLHTPIQNRDNKRKNKRRKVKTYRILTVENNQQLLPDAATPKRTIECPNWGVIGHFRNLKNGNRTWVKPHRKGKHRHQPEFYESKEYELAH